MVAYKEVYGAALREKKDTKRFTKGTDPASQELMDFLLDDFQQAPTTLPMEAQDAVMTANVTWAMILNPEIP